MTPPQARCKLCMAFLDRTGTCNNPKCPTRQPAGIAVRAYAVTNDAQRAVRRPASLNRDTAAQPGEYPPSENLYETWQANGFDPEEAHAWYHHGHDPEQASMNRALGLTPAEGAAWGWSGFEDKHIGDWVDAGVRDPRIAMDWLNSNVPAYDVAKWQRHGFDPTSVRGWAWNPVTNKTFEPEEALRWRNAGFDALDAHQWRRHINDPRLARTCRERGLYPWQARDAIADQQSPPRSAQ